ncbi:MAG: acyloxyacyl hydrolase [Bacteroidales bacterium]|nr:acyloxyacyl hydrolase [Bacteroidales bacterium]
MNKSIALLIFMWSCTFNACEIFARDADSLFTFNEKRNWQLSLTSHFGKIVKNYGNMPDRTASFIHEFHFGIVTNGSKQWHHLYNFPEVGASFLYSDFGNDNVLGQNFAIIPNITFSPSSYKPFNVKVTLGMGLAYFTRPFDEETNTENRLVGSAVANMSMASFYIHRYLNKHFDMLMGLTAFHCSNGHYKVPNYGLNFPAVHLGIKYRPNGDYKIAERNNIYERRGPLKFNFRVGMGVHEFAGTNGPVGTSKWGIYTSSLYVSKRFGPVSNIHCGFAVKYYNDFYNKIIKDSIYTENQHLKSGVLTFLLAHELMINKVGFLVQGGLDLYNPFYNKWHELTDSEKTIFTFLESITSTRIGFQYYFFDPKMNSAKNIFIGAYVKANFGKADYVGMNIGFVL